MAKKEAIRDSRLVGFRTSEENVIKIGVASSCRQIDKQRLFNDMIDLYFEKKPLTVSELNVLKQTTKSHRRK